MIKLLLHPFFLACALLSAINKLIELSGFHIPFVHAYMDDIFCMPVMLTFILFFQRRFVFNNENYVFSTTHIFVAVVYCSLVFEIILPLHSKGYTADFFDVMAYSIGGIIFHKFINRPQPMPSVTLATRKISSASSLVCDSA